MYLIFEKESKRVYLITENIPTDLNDKVDFVSSETFKIGDEIENAIFVHSHKEIEGVKFLTGYSSFAISPSMADVLKNNQQIKADNEKLKALVADLGLIVGGGL